MGCANVGRLPAVAGKVVGEAVGPDDGDELGIGAADVDGADARGSDSSPWQAAASRPASPKASVEVARIDMRPGL